MLVLQPLWTLLIVVLQLCVMIQQIHISMQAYVACVDISEGRIHRGDHPHWMGRTEVYIELSMSCRNVGAHVEKDIGIR